MSLALLEYEEQFGRLWDRLVGNQPSWPRFPEAAVTLEAERRRLAVLFRGMGGHPGLELVAGTAAVSGHRLRLVQKLGMSEERLLRAERTAELVLLPPVLDCLPAAELNRDLYVWLIAFLAGAEPSGEAADPLQRDVARLRWAEARTAAVLHEFAGLRRRHARLAGALLALRPTRRLPPAEAAIAILASQGLSLPIIGALLGHSQPQTTARYAHLFDDPLRAAAERVGAVLTSVDGRLTHPRHLPSDEIYAKISWLVVSCEVIE